MFEKKPQSKAQQSKERILHAAYKLFKDKGFEKTNMRQIAQKSNLALGGIYYYFKSKEDIVHEFYKSTNQKHVDTCTKNLDQYVSFKEKLHYVLKSSIDLALEHHQLSKALFKVACNPDSPLSPLSHESNETRQKSLNMFKLLTEQSKQSIPKQLHKLLPDYLWLIQIGIIAFWIHDRSEQFKKTYAIINIATNVCHWFLTAFKAPFLGAFKKNIIKHMQDFQPFARA